MSSNKPELPPQDGLDTGRQPTGARAEQAAAAAPDSLGAPKGWKWPTPRAEKIPEIDSLFEAPHWNYAQLVAWVAHRQRRLVVQASDDYTRSVEKRGKVPGEDKLRHYEDSVGPIGFLRLDLELARDGGHSTEDAAADILEVLRSGKLCARGRVNGRGDRVEIEPHLWHDLEFLGDPPAAQNKSPRAATQVVTDFLFERVKVLELWPDGDVPAAPEDMPLIEGASSKSGNKTSKKRGKPRWRYWDYLEKMLRTWADKAPAALQRPDGRPKSVSQLIRDVKGKWDKNWPPLPAKTALRNAVVDALTLIGHPVN